MTDDEVVKVAEARHERVQCQILELIQAEFKLNAAPRYTEVVEECGGPTHVVMIGTDDVMQVYCVDGTDPVVSIYFEPDLCDALERAIKFYRLRCIERDREDEEFVTRRDARLAQLAQEQEKKS